MKRIKHNKKLKGLLVFIFIGLLLIFFLFEYNKDENRFKRNYTKYNNKTNCENGCFKYINVQFEDKINIDILNSKQLINMFNEGTGIILIGNYKNNNSRQILNMLLESLDDNKLYYYDYKDVVEGYLNDKKIATEYYVQILNKLDFVTNDIIEGPIVLGIKNGLIVDYNYKGLGIDSNLELDEEEKKILLNTYKNIISKISEN